MGWQDDEVISGGSGSAPIPGTAATRAAWEADEVIGGRGAAPPDQGLTINMTRKAGAGEGGEKRDAPAYFRPAIGANKAIADMAGAPVDATTWVVNQGIKAVGGEPIKDPIGGSESIKKAMGWVGANPDQFTPPATRTEKLLETAGEGAAMLAVPGAALARPATTTKTLGATLGDILGAQTIDESIAAFVGGIAGNLAVGGAAAVGAELAADEAPEVLKPVAALAGGVVGGVGAAGALAGGGAAVRTAARAAERALQPAEARAAQTILDRAEQPLTLRDRVAEAAEAPPLVEGSQPTVFQATGDLGVGALEREVAASPRGVPRFAERRQEQNRARTEAIESVAPEADPGAVAVRVRAGVDDLTQRGAEAVTGAKADLAEALGRLSNPNATPEDFAQYVRARLQSLTDSHAERVGTAAREVTETLARAGGEAFDNPAAYGDALRAPLAGLHQRAKDEASTLWRAIDPDLSAAISPQPLKETVAELVASIPKTAKPAAGEEASIIKTINGLGDDTTFGEVVALRGRLTDAIRDARREGTPTELRRLSIVLDGVDDALARSAGDIAADPAVRTGLMQRLGIDEATLAPRNAELTPDGVARYGEARAATRQMKQTFESGAVGKVLAPDGERGSFRMTASNVAKNLFDRPEDLRAFVTAAADSPEALSAARDYAAFSLRKAAVKDGLLSPEKYEKWAADHAATLKEFPDLATKFGDVRKAQGALDDALVSQGRALEDYQKGALARVVAGDDAASAVGAALSRPAEFSAIVARAKENPEALEGLKKAVADYLSAKSVVTAEGQAPRVSTPALERNYLQNRAALAQLFDESDLARKFGEIRRAETTVADALKVQKESLSEYQSTAVRDLLGGGDPIRVVGAAITKPGELARLAGQVADDPAAAAGLKRAVVDFMMSKARSTAEEGTSGIERINAATLQKFFLQNRKALASVFDEAELRNISNVTADLQKANRSIVALKIPGGSNTAQDTASRWAAIFSKVWQEHGGKAMGATAGSVGGPYGSAGGFAAGIVWDAVRAARLESIDKTLVEMMLDPKMAAAWMAKVPLNTEAEQGAFARQLRMIAGNQVVQAIGRVETPSGAVDTTRQIAEARDATETAPTDGQKEAGNYTKGRVSFHGIPFVMENPVGSIRRGVDGDGKAWESKLPADYGYVSGTVGADGDHVDAYIGPDHASKRAWVIDQVDPKTGDFDEHKIIVGAPNWRAARDIYERAFSDGSAAQRLGHATPMSLDELKTWLREGDTKKPTGPN